MAKRTISYEDYEGDKYEDYTGDEPKVGAWYTGEVVRGIYDEDKDQMIWFIKLVDHPDYEGWVKGYYAPFEGGSKFRGQDFAIAIQGGTKKPLSFDPENEAQVANVVKRAKRIKFKTDEYDGRVKIGKVRALLQGVAGGAAPTPAPTPQDAPEGEDFEDYTEEELAEKEVSELEAILKEEFEVDLPAKPRRDPKGDKYFDALVDAILEAQEETDEGDSPETDGTAVDPDPGDDEFDDGFEEDPEPEPEPEPAPPARRARKAAPAKAAAPAASSRRRRS